MFQIQNRIADQLPRAVIGDLASPLASNEVDSELLQPVAINQNAPHPSPSPQGQHRRVFQKDQEIREKGVGFFLVNQEFLEIPGGLIRNKSQVQPDYLLSC